MAHGWNDYERAAEQGPLSFVLKVVVGFFIVSVFVGVVGYSLGWFGEAAQVAGEEFGPRAMLQKYEWFKNASAQLDAKRANVEVLDSRMKAMQASYQGVLRGNWPREDREQYNVWVSETAGVKAGYNQLAAEYNAQMAKFNWRFANAGELPVGADKPLPREYKPYVTE